MSHNVEQMKGTDFDPTKPFKRELPYQDFLLLNEIQSTVLRDLKRNRIFYYTGVAVSVGSVIAPSVIYYGNYLNQNLWYWIVGCVALNTVTITLLRSRYNGAVKFMGMLMMLRVNNKLMRDQDKPDYYEYAKIIRMPSYGLDVIRGAVYLPYAEEEVNAPLNPDNTSPNGFHQFSTKLFNRVLFSELTSQISLEIFGLVGFATVFSLVLSDSDSPLLKFGIWAFTFFVVLLAIWTISTCRKSALTACADGTFEKHLAELHSPRRYTFFRFGEHLLHISLSLLMLAPIFFGPGKVQLPTWQQNGLYVAAFFTLIFAIGAVYRAVQRANSFKKMKDQKAK